MCGTPTRGERGRAQAVLVNSGWEAEGADAAARLARVPLPRLVPAGFVFVWARKQHVAALVRQLYCWGYCYVENLTWVQLGANNTVLTLPAPYAQRSHLTLLIFRKDGARRRPARRARSLSCSAASGCLPEHLACMYMGNHQESVAAGACGGGEPPARAQARARTSSCGTSATRTSSSTVCGRAAVRRPASETRQSCFCATPVEHATTAAARRARPGLQCGKGYSLARAACVAQAAHSTRPRRRWWQ